MAQSRLREKKPGKYDYSGECPICGKHVFWVNGASNSDLVYIKSRRKTVNVFHYDCIEKERRENAKR